MHKGLERLTQRAKALLSGNTIPAIEGERVRPNLHGIGQPGVIHWESVETVSLRRKSGSRRKGCNGKAPISKWRAQI